MRSGTRAIVTLAVCVCVFSAVSAVTPSRACAAPEGTPSPEIRQKASSLFTRGEALYRIGDYAHAAALFDEAYRLAPHPDILWNAARSFERAGEIARAANAYAEYLEGSSETSPDRKDALEALERLSRKLGRLEVHAPAGATIFLNGTQVVTSKPYVVPGSHSIRIVAVGASEDEHTVEVEAGSARSVSLSQPPVEAPGLKREDESKPAKPAVEERRKLSPLFFVAGAALSAAATGVAIGFGIDTLNARSRFDKSPSQEAFDSGQDKELRTNVMLGVAAGLWALTAVTGVWLVEWKSRSTTVSLAIASSSAGIRGVFE
jgi:hypothetical protein